MYFVFFKLMNRDFEESHDEMVSRSWFIEDISEEKVIGWRRSMSSTEFVTRRFPVRRKSSGPARLIGQV